MIFNFERSVIQNHVNGHHFQLLIGIQKLKPLTPAHNKALREIFKFASFCGLIRDPRSQGNQ